MSEPSVGLLTFLVRSSFGLQPSGTLNWRGKSTASLCVAHFCLTYCHSRPYTEQTCFQLLSSASLLGLLHADSKKKNNEIRTVHITVRMLRSQCNPREGRVINVHKVVCDCQVLGSKVVKAESNLDWFVFQLLYMNILESTKRFKIWHSCKINTECYEWPTAITEHSKDPWSIIKHKEQTSDTHVVWSVKDSTPHWAVTKWYWNNHRMLI